MLSLDTLASWSSLPLMILFTLKSATPHPESAIPTILARDGDFYLVEHWACIWLCSGIQLGYMEALGSTEVLPSEFHTSYKSSLIHLPLPKAQVLSPHSCFLWGCGLWIPNTLVS